MYKNGVCVETSGHYQLPCQSSAREGGGVAMVTHNISKVSTTTEDQSVEKGPAHKSLH